MVGYVQDAVANALREWPALKTANIMPVRATEGSSVVVNTPLPAIAIQINAVDGNGYSFGRGIRQYFELTLHVLLEINNYTFSKDAGKQAAMLDLSDEVIRCMENSRMLDDIKQKHDFNRQFNRMETETTYGSKGSISVVVDVHKVIYDCDVAFDMGESAFKNVELEKVKIDNGTSESTIP